MVSRSVALSNTMYSVLLEGPGKGNRKFLLLGSEWIGSLVKYQEKSIHHRKMQIAALRIKKIEKRKKKKKEILNTPHS